MVCCNALRYSRTNDDAPLALGREQMMKRFQKKSDVLCTEDCEALRPRREAPSSFVIRPAFTQFYAEGIL
jgi:hypothetical protein